MRELSMKRPSLYLTAVCLCILIFGAFITTCVDVSHRVAEASYPVSRQMRYAFTLQNTTNRLLKHAEFWTYVPVKQTSTQRCVHLETYHPYQLILDELGNQILHFAFDNLPPYAAKIITIKADLELSDTPNRTFVQDVERFLQAEKYVESDEPELCRFAEKFKDRKQIKTAENIFRWVAENMQYTGYSGNDRGALYALRNKRGDCTEYMYLFVALCRANGIPARGIGGYVCRANAFLKPSDYHNWAEFYQAGAWRIADPQKKVFAQNQSDYIGMRVIGESQNNPMGKFHRFRFEGKGLKVKMNQ